MDTVSKAARSRIMARVKSSGNRSTELELIRRLREQGLAGWRRNYPLPGSPDFVFRQKRVAVFVDGCFWHGCRKHCRLPAANRAYWQSKIERNASRDRAVSRELKRAGWSVVRIWEHAVAAPATLRKLKRLL